MLFQVEIDDMGIFKLETVFSVLEDNELICDIHFRYNDISDEFEMEFDVPEYNECFSANLFSEADEKMRQCETKRNTQNYFRLMGI